MKLVVKIGGAALDDRELVGKFARTIPDLCREGHKLVIVHGGGAALSRTLKQLGCETTFVNGLRVTDSQTRDVAMMVLAGQLNKQLVAAIGDAGQPAIGICGGDLRIFRATKKKQPDLGYVGESARSIFPGSSACGTPEWSRSSPVSRWASTANTTTSTPTRWRRLARWLAAPTR